MLPAQLALTLAASPHMRRPWPSLLTARPFWPLIGYVCSTQYVTRNMVLKGRCAGTKRGLTLRAGPTGSSRWPWLARQQHVGASRVQARTVITSCACLQSCFVDGILALALKQGRQARPRCMVRGRQALPPRCGAAIGVGGPIRAICWGRGTLNRKQTLAGCLERAAAFGFGAGAAWASAGCSGDGSGAGGAAGGRCGSR